MPNFGHIFTEAGTQAESVKMNKACSELEDGKIGRQNNGNIVSTRIRTYLFWRKVSVCNLLLPEALFI